MTRWTTADIPSQQGRTVIVTGANGGLGKEMTRALAHAGARVILACRDLDKGRAVSEAIDGDTEVRRLDLADLSSVRAFADGVDEEVAVLINNAGIMAVPKRTTVDGFESQIGTNHLGPFALTGMLLDRVRDRVVTVSSTAHQFGKIRSDMNWEQSRYERWLAYGQSKLANLLFAYELHRRLRAAGSETSSTVAHPGYADTGLQGRTESFQDHIMTIGNWILAQSAAMGALPILYAATAPDVASGSYVGPGGPAQVRGYPKIVKSNARSRDTAAADELWNTSERLTGVTYQF